MARTEISAAAERSIVNMSLANPFVDLIDWRLSSSHKERDICDDYAENGPYTPDQVPSYPAHPHDLCSLIPMTMMDTNALNEFLRRRIAAGQLTHLQGAFNVQWIVTAMVGGYFVGSVAEALSIS